MEKFKLILAILYILSPIDIVPEVLLGPFGLLDDGMALLYALSYFLEDKGNKKNISSYDYKPYENNYKQVSTNYSYSNQAQNSEETIVITEKPKTSNIKSWIIGILFLGVIGGGIYYYLQIKNENKINYSETINRNSIPNNNIEKNISIEETVIKNINTPSQSQNISKEEIKNSNKYNGPERNQFIILNGEEVYIDENGNIIRE